MAFNTQPPWFANGTVTTNGTNKVIGLNTSWTDVASIALGDMLTLDGLSFYQITGIGDGTLNGDGTAGTQAGTQAGNNTIIQVDRTIPTGATQAYAILQLAQVNPINSDIAFKVSAMVQSWQGREDELIAWLGGASGTFNLTDAVGKTTQVKCPAQMQADADSAVATFNLSKNVANGLAGLDANGELTQNLAGAAAQVALGRTGARKRADGLWDGTSILLPAGYDLHLWSDGLVSGQVYAVYNPVNAPSAGWWYVEILRHTNDGTGNQYRALRLTAMVSTAYPNGTIFISTNSLGTWSAWRRIATDEPLVWINPTIINGWTNTTAYVYYAREDSRTIHIRGSVTGGSNTTYSDIFVLPVGFRPPASRRFVAGTNGGVAQCIIAPTGVVTFAGGEPHTGTATLWLALDTIFKAV